MVKIDLKTYQAIFDMIPIGLGIAAISGKLLIYNQAMLEPGGYKRKDIEPLSSVIELYYDLEDRMKILGLAKKHGQVNNFKVRFKRKNGQPYFTLMSLRPIYFQDQPGWLATVLDIDDQVKTEENLKEKVKELERMNKLMVGRELKMIELKALLKMRNKK